MEEKQTQNSPTGSGSTGYDCSVAGGAPTERIIMDTSDEAATYMTGLSGWVSRDGIYFGNDKDSESLARFHGCTHVACKYCGEPAPKRYTACDKCNEERAIERFYKRPEKEWDGESCIYSDADGRYFYDLESAEEYADEKERTIKDLRLIICEPIPYRLVEDDYWEDCLPEDGDLPNEVKEAIDYLNKVLSNADPVTFTPGKFRLKL